MTSNGGSTREELLEDAVNKTRKLLREYERLTETPMKEDPDGWSRFRDECVLLLLYDANRMADYVEEQLL